MRSTIAIVMGASAVVSAACTTLPSGDTSEETFGNPSTSTSDSMSTSSSSGMAGDATTTGGMVDSSSSDDGATGLKLDVASDDTGGTIPEVAEVFGHSGNVLYRLDPDTKEIVEVGPFSGCTASIIDIALNADSEMYGTAFSSLWSIDRMTGQCTMIAEGSYPTSLSFVPADTVAAGEEALVGFNGSDYIRIDTETGAITDLNTLADGLASSGDMVSVKNGGSFLTVTGPGCSPGDCIIEINPANGIVLQNYGPLPYDQVFGLAFWAGRAYGFAREGVLFEIEFNGDTVSTTPIPFPVAPPDLEFFGAGSTTSAPPAEG